MRAIGKLRESSRSLAGTGSDDPPRPQARLAFASFLMLFVELALIRWTAANNVYVTNATNFVLLASFLGIGVGFLNARSTRDYLRWTPLALLALVAWELAFPVILATQAGPHPYQGLRGAAALPKPLTLAVVFVLSVAVMAGFGQDISSHKPMTFEELEDWEGLNFDLIITLSPEAHHTALELTHTLAADVEYWPTHDPTGAEGNREQKLEAYREVCDSLLLRIRKRFSKVGAASG